jgi:hypothetical protein
VEQHLEVDCAVLVTARHSERHGGRVFCEEEKTAARKKKSLNGNGILHVVEE